MERPSAFELAVLEKFAEGDSPRLEVLRAQVKAATVTGRLASAAGLYLDLVVPQSVASLGKDVSVILGDVMLESPALRSGAGFLLWIGGGRIYMLEGFTYDEPWLASPTEFVLKFQPDRDRARVDDLLSPKPIILP